MRSCRQHGGNVAEIREPLANKAIVKLREARRLEGKPNFIIAAGNDEEEEGTWVWPSDGKVFFTHGSPVAGEYHNWARPRLGDDPAPDLREPITDPDPALDDKQNCMVMLGNGPNKGMWRDSPCDKKSVVCEAPVATGEAVYLEDLSSLE